MIKAKLNEKDGRISEVLRESINRLELVNDHSKGRIIYRDLA